MKFLSATLAIVAAAGPVAAADLTQQFLDEYAKELPHLMNQYVRNKKVVVAVRAFDRLGATGTLSASGTVTSVSDGVSVRINGINDVFGKQTNPVGGLLLTPDEAYSVRSSDGKVYAIGSHTRSTLPGLDYEVCVRGTCLYFPLAYGGGRRITDCFDPPEGRRKDRYVITAREDTTLDGTPAIKLSVQETLGNTARLYLDKTNHLAFLRYEADDWTNLKTNKRTGYKVVSELKYTPTAAGPMPSRLEKYLLKPDGTRIPRDEYTFSSYEPYTPQSGDFDLEKQFGVKPLPGTPAASAARSWRWLYAVAAALALVTAGLVVAARRRRGSAA